MEEKSIPEWLLRLRAANGTEDEPNTDESVNYFNIQKLSSSETVDPFGTSRPKNPYEDEATEYYVPEDLAIRIPKRRTPLEDMLEERKCDTLFIKCNVDGDAIVRSHKDLQQYGDTLIKKLFDSHVGVISVDMSNGARKLMSRRRVLVYDIDPACVAMYCIAYDGRDERVVRVTVDEYYKTELSEEADEAIAVEVYKLYRNPNA